MDNPLSPLTGRSNTSLTDIFFSKDIIKLYQHQLDMDVSSFFKGADSFFLYQCNDTGYRFYHPKGMDGDGAFYASLQQKLGADYYHDWKFENQMAYDHLKPDDKLLDIGCGVGKFLTRAKEKTKDAAGLELNEKAVAQCRSNGLDVYNEMIGPHADSHTGYYDMVIMFQVLEHIYDVESFLKDSLRALKSGGKLVIGVPNNEPWFQGYDKYCTLNLPPHHMGLWNADVFVKTAQLLQLKILDIQYDVKGSIKTYAYLRAKYMARIKSPAGKHSLTAKLILMAYGCITLPIAIFKKLTTGIHGSHIALVFEKQ